MESSQYKQVCVLMVMKEHVIQCNSLVNLCVFISFWTMDYGTEEEDVSHFGYRHNTS